MDIDKYLQLSEESKMGKFTVFIVDKQLIFRQGDLPPEKESSFMLDWELRKGALDGQKVLHARADYQLWQRSNMLLSKSELHFLALCSISKLD